MEVKGCVGGGGYGVGVGEGCVDVFVIFYGGKGDVREWVLGGGGGGVGEV